jgi:hypothetical protein
MERPTEFADIPDEIRAMRRAQLERAATPALNSLMDAERDRVTRARAELVWRDHEYAEAQETSRRKFETDHQAARQDFEEKLAQRQMDHAAKLAREQLNTVQAAAKAAKWAAWAAGVAALGAIGQIIVAFVR